MAFKGVRFASMEWRNLAASKAMWVVIAAIAVIPLLYGGLYLAAFQNPYGRLESLPVAVVNEDEGAVIAAERRNLGDEVVDELKRTDNGLGWHFVSAGQAQAGLEDGTYFMTCTIPADFSASVASVDGDAPRRAQLKVEYNESENMLASQIGQTVWSQVRKRVSDTVAERYWTTVLDRVAASGEEIRTAAEGAGELESGLVTAQDGSRAIATNLGTLKNGALALDSGLGALAGGALSLDAGLGSLAGGAGALEDGAGALVSGTRRLAGGAGQVAAGAGTVAGGAEQLRADGTSRVAAGASELAQATESLPGSAAELADGSRQITEGLGQAVASIGAADEPGQTLAFASQTVASGLATLSGGLGEAEAGVGRLSGGLAQLGSGLTAAQDGATALEGALQEAVVALQASTDPASRAAAQALVDAGALDLARGKAVSDGIAQAAASVGEPSQAGTLAGGAAAVSAGLAQARASIGDASTPGDTLAYGSASVTEGLAALGSSLAQARDGSAHVSDGAAELAGQAPALVSSIERLDAGAGEVNAQMGALASGAAQVASGASQVDAGATDAAAGAARLDDGAAELAAGAQSAKGGAAELAQGAQSAQAGAGRLASGASQLREGSGRLVTGLHDAVEGTGELASKLAAGADAAAEQTKNIPAKAEVMSDPVELANDYYTTVKNYGTGFAPYFMALGLWVGSLVSGFVFKPLNGRMLLAGANPVTAALANYLPMALFALVQAALLMAVVQFGLQLQIDNVPAFYGVGFLTTLVFAAVMQLLMAAFGFPGRFIAIILLMLQLTTSAGTFPIQTTPAFFQAVNPFLPMTYVVEALRQVMTGLDYGTVAFDCLVLLGFGAASFALTALVAWRKRTVTMQDLHPLLKLG